MSSKVLNPTYDEIHDACVHAALTMQELDWKFRRILGVARGGLIPAVILSHLIGTPLTPISYSSAQGRGDDKNHNNKLPDIRGEVILLVDDICDSGHTLSEIARHYTMLNNSVYTFVLYYKEQAIPPIVPTFKWRTIPVTSDWVNFPFELNKFIVPREQELCAW